MESCTFSSFPVVAGVLLCSSSTTLDCFDTQALPTPELGNCDDAEDNDLDGFEDCADSECTADAACCAVPNPCGGCTTLDGAPGETCGTGTWACDGAESVVCSDLCFGVTCDAAPQATCVNDVATDYPATGVCDSGTGACTYAPTVTDCAGAGQMCNDGVCTLDACATNDNRGCYTGAQATLDVGACHTGVQTCTAGTWGTCQGETLPSAEECSDQGDNDCDGLVDCDDPDCAGANECCAGNACGGCATLDAQPGTACGDGFYTCVGADNVQCSDLCFEVTCDAPPADSCLGDTLLDYPATGTCNETDGSCEYAQTTTNCAATSDTCVNGACAAACETDDARACYSADPATIGVGACGTGTQTCTGGTWGACVGEMVPQPEVCADALDNDCDGYAGCEDDDCLSDPVCGVSCGGGFDDCNGFPEDGCETAIMNDPMNCGECGYACAGQQFCDNGVCN